MANWTRLAAEIAAAEVPDYEIFTSIASLFGLDGLSFNDGDKVIARVSDFFQLDSVPCLALTLFFAGAGSYFSSWLTLEETSQCHCFKRASWGESSGCSSPLNTETFVVFDGRKLVKPTCFQKRHPSVSKAQGVVDSRSTFEVCSALKSSEASNALSGENVFFPGFTGM